MYKKPQKIVGLRNTKQIGAITNGEKGVNTHAVCLASATAQFVLIFKRMIQNLELENGTLEDNVLSISESGYINSTLFVEWIKQQLQPLDVSFLRLIITYYIQVVVNG